MKFIKNLISDIEAMSPEKREAKQSAAEFVSDCLFVASQFLALLLCVVCFIGLYLELFK